MRIKEKGIKAYLRYLGYILTVLSLAFVVKKLLGLDTKSFKELNTKGLIILLCALFIYIAADVLLAYAWSKMLDHFSCEKVDKKRAVSVYLKANIGKYIPGSVFQYVQRNLFLENYEIEQKNIALSSFIEIISMLFAAIIIGIRFLSKTLGMLWDQYKTYIVSAVVIAVLILLTVIIVIKLRSNKFAQLLSAAFCKKNILCLVINILLCLTALLLISVSFVLTAKAFGLAIDNFTEFYDLIAVHICSWLAGYVVIGAPGGIGVKEAVFTLLLTGNGSASILLTAALIHRLLSIAGDIICFAFSSIFSIKKK